MQTIKQDQSWHLTVTAVIAIFALGAGLLLIPRQDEYVAMLARDGRYEEAARRLLSIHKVGDRRPEMLMQALVLRLKLGDIPGALEAAQAVLAVRPGDRGAQQLLADLLLQSGRLEEYFRVAESLLRDRPDPNRLSHLLALYRHHGRYEEELKLLQAFAGSRQLNPSQYERLAALLSARGDWEAAAFWLRRIDQYSPGPEFTARLRLQHVLLEGGRLDEAQRLAERWLIKWRDPYLAGKLLARLAQAGAMRGVQALAQICIERMPKATFQIAAVLTESSQAAVARELLARWADRTSAPSPEAARNYVHASLAAADRRKPVETLLRLVRTGGRPEVQAAFAEEIAYGYGPEMLAQLLAILPRSVLEAEPLLAAQIAQLGGNRPLTEWYFDRVDPARLARHQQEIWLSLLRSLQPAPLVLQTLIELRRGGRLPPELFANLAEAEVWAAAGDRATIGR